jgi:formylglycine-generating enzyme required for sulfatase activity
VSVADFQAFYESAKSTAIEVGAPCAPVTVTPSGVVANDAVPVTNVTFCEARAFCEWAGKRLCGRVGGGELATGELTTQTSAWFNACTAGTSEPVHLLSDAGCQLEASAPAPAGSTCQGGLPALFDMVGNVWEWVDAPTTPDGAKPQSFFMGGGFSHPPGTNCTAVGVGPTDFRASDVGFRCCSP